MSSPVDYLMTLYDGCPDELVVNLFAWNKETKQTRGEFVSLANVRKSPKLVETFASQAEADGLDVGHGIALCKPGTSNPSGKASLTDLAPRIEFIFADRDPPADASDDWAATEAARLNGHKCTALNFTGNGLHEIHRIDPCGQTKARRILDDLIANADGDVGAKGLNQIARLPGTINTKNGKRSKNLKIDPTHRHRPTTIRDSFLDHLPLSAEDRVLMLTGKASDGREMDESAARFAVLLSLVAAGTNDDDLLTLLEDYPDLAIAPKNSKKNTAHWREQEIARVLAKLPTWLVEMNQKYFVCFHGGKTAIAELIRVGNREMYQFTRPGDKREFFDNKTVAIGDSRANMWAAWMRNPRRRTYRNVVMRPDKSSGPLPNGDFNLWRGFTVDPQPGDFSIFRELVETVICASDPVLIEYVWQWLAFLVQRPGDRHEVALVLRGGKGTGKGTFARELGALFGPHYLPTGSVGDIVGRFNVHLRECLLLFADEAIAAETTAHDSKIKPLITDDTIPCEPKNLPKVWEPNRLSWIIASNNDHVIKATSDERRYCVTNVSTCRQKDVEFFGNLRTQMENGGRSALLDHLLKIDLSDFEPRRYPETEALHEQQDASLDAFELFWRDRLMAGDHEAADVLSWETVPTKLLLWQAQEHGQRIRRAGAPTSAVDFGRRLNEFLAPLKFKKAHPSSFHWRGTEVPSNTYRLPPLSECRENFETYLGRSIDWTEGADHVPRFEGDLPKDIAEAIARCNAELVDLLSVPDSERDMEKVAQVRRAIDEHESVAKQRQEGGNDDDLPY